MVVWLVQCGLRQRQANYLVTTLRSPRAVQLITQLRIVLMRLWRRLCGQLALPLAAACTRSPHGHPSSSRPRSGSRLRPAGRMRPPTLEGTASAEPATGWQVDE